MPSRIFKLRVFDDQHIPAVADILFGNSEHVHVWYEYYAVIHMIVLAAWNFLVYLVNIIVNVPKHSRIESNQEVKNYLIHINERDLSVNLIVFPLQNKDIIYGMNWKAMHQTILDTYHLIIYILACYYSCH